MYISGLAHRGTGVTPGLGRGCLGLVTLDKVLTCPAASVSPHRALDATPTLSPNAGTSPVLQFCEIPAMDSPRTCAVVGLAAAAAAGEGNMYH